MADMTGRDRGQIILVAAFALAVIFLTLALVVNSAIFTENLASRSDTTGSDSALTNRAVVEQNVGEAVASANRNNPASLVSSVQANIQSYQSQAGPQQATSGRLVSLSYDTETFGARVAYDGGQFSGGVGNSYTLADNIDKSSESNGTRAFKINATNLPNTYSDAFVVQVGDGAAADEWVTRIWNDGGVVEVETTRDILGGTETCRISEGPGDAPIIDLTEGTVNGEPCDALGTNDAGENYNFGAGAADGYRIEFVRANEIEGDFTVVIDTSPSDVTAPSSPTNALYDVTVEYTYTTNDVRYVTDNRVAPGEPHA